MGHPERSHGNNAQVPDSTDRIRGSFAFVHDFQPYQIKNALNQAYFHPENEEVLSPNNRLTINFRGINKPKWLNPNGLIIFTQRMNGERYWHELLNSSSDKTQTDVSDFVQKHVKISNTPGYYIFRSNDRFMGAAVSAAVLGAATGNSVHKALRKRDIFGFLRFIPRIKTGFDLGRQIGEHYETPAQNPDELLQRLKELFPAKIPRGKPDNELDLFNRLVTTNTFDRMRDGKTNRCPAIPLTRSMFEAFGEIMATEEGEKIFLDAVVKK